MNFFRMYADFTQESTQLFLLLLFYIFLRNANSYEMCKIIFKKVLTKEFC